MSLVKYLFLFFLLSINTILATEFTVASYNTGGLTGYYDYIRAVSMEPVMQERHIAEPDLMALNEKIQNIALKILFSKDPEEQQAAKMEWSKNNYDKAFSHITAPPGAPNSPNTIWKKKVDGVITPYNERPIIIKDSNVLQKFTDHMMDLTRGSEANFEETVKQTYDVMATRIFRDEMKFDIISLQEADHLDPSMFPENFQVVFSDQNHSLNGIAWNLNRFDYVETIANIQERGFIVKLLEKESGKTVAIASGHLSGSNPFTVEIDPKTGKPDSERGDNELSAILACLEEVEADIKIVAMDSNVTATHPRLRLLQQADFTLDYNHYLDPTCASPHQALNTRIDWIAAKTDGATPFTITNIPVLNVGLNSMRTNLSDHKPIAAKIVVQ